MDFPYYHLSPVALERRGKLKYEANECARRQAVLNQIAKRLSDEEGDVFWNDREAHFNNVKQYTHWLDGQLNELLHQLPQAEQIALYAAISAEAKKVGRLLPYSNTFAPAFIEKLKAEQEVEDYLQFVREPHYPGAAGFYLFDKADDLAYFRDLIADHLDQYPQDHIPKMRRAIRFLTAEIERMAEPGANPFRSSIINSRQPVAPKSPLDDVRRFFPAVAAALGNNPTEKSALADLAFWLVRWAERYGHRPESKSYSLAGRLREQQAAHPNAGKFLKACHRLHKALLPIAANEQALKELLNS